MIGTLSLSALAREIPAEIIGGDVMFSRVSTDTRTLMPGDLFVALRGPNFDGTTYASEAESRGAVGVVVTAAQDVKVPQAVVADAEQALGRLAALNRQRSAATVLAITGSQGKTSVKEMTGLILQQSFRVLVTEGNLNNTIGVPLTLLRLAAEHQKAVIELGANAAGEIALTANITAPHIVLINNAAETHLQGFGDLTGVVKAKGEIIDSSEITHTVVLNADDKHCDDWVKRAGQRTCRLFSVQGNASADYMADQIKPLATGVEFRLTSPQGSITCHLPLVGVHNVSNAVAAAAMAMEAGATLADVRAGLEQMRPVPGRLAPAVGVNECRLLDDTYNASPASFRAAIDVLAAIKGERATVLIMGDMGELGDSNTVNAHREVGLYAAACGIDSLWTTGSHSLHASRAFAGDAHHFEDKRSLLEYAKQHLNANMIVLIKGSRSAAMDEISTQLIVEESN